MGCTSIRLTPSPAERGAAVPDNRTNEQKAAEILAIRLELDPGEISAAGWFFTEKMHDMVWTYREVVRNSHGTLQLDRNENVKTKERRIVVPPELYQEFLNHKENGTPN